MQKHNMSFKLRSIVAAILVLGGLIYFRILLSSTHLKRYSMKIPKLWAYLNWLNGTHWRLEYALFLFYQGESEAFAISTARKCKNNGEYLDRLTYTSIGTWKDFTDTQLYKQIQLKPFADLTPWIAFLYTTIGGGHELLNFFRDGHVSASFPLLALSCLIFVGRIGYAYESKAKATLASDYYGGAVMLILSLLKLIF